MAKKRRGYIAKFDSPCYFSYLSGCNDIKSGELIVNRGYAMNWHKTCQPKDVLPSEL
tara:strand:+ start:1630 stop:1800 length:171 start_codon:yes stop_codon:yes gene_type:complete